MQSLHLRKIHFRADSKMKATRNESFLGRVSIKEAFLGLFIYCMCVREHVHMCVFVCACIRVHTYA